MASNLLLVLAAAAGAHDFSSVEVKPLVLSARQAVPQGGVWASFSRADLAQPAFAKLGLGAPRLTAGDSALYHVAEEDLAKISQAMHEGFGRCGGYFAYSTRREAEAHMSPMARSAGGPYTVDQGDVVRPLTAKATEAGIRSTIESLASYHNRYYQSEGGVAAPKWLKDKWQSLAPKGAAALVAHPSWKQSSVVLTIPGTDLADEIVVLGGHLDSIGGMWGGEKARAPGVDDNASGIASLTEAIRILGEAGFKPRRTIQFMGYAAEEVGLRGSNEIARSYASQGKKVAAVLQLDMTNFKGSELDVYMLTDNVDPALTEFLGKLADAYLGVKWGTTKCGYGCSDHASWTRAGFPASAAFESAFDGMNKNIHTDRDTLANSGGSAAHSVSFAKLAVAFAVEIAKAAPATQATPAAGAGSAR